MYSFYLAVLCLLIFCSPVSTFKRQDRHIGQTRPKNWVEPSNTEVISLQDYRRNLELQHQFWRQQNRFPEPVAEVKGRLDNRRRFETNIMNMSIVPPLPSEDFFTRNNGNDEAVRPLMSENGRITRPIINDMTINLQGNSERIEEKKDRKNLGHLMDEVLRIPKEGYIRSDKLSDWLTQMKREDVPINDMMTKCAAGEIKLTKTFVCVTCTVFADLEDNVCGSRDFQQVCVESWTKACGLDRASTVPARLRNPQDYELLNEQIQSA